MIIIFVLTCLVFYTSFLKVFFFVNHELPEISESCEVAIDLLSHYNKDSFE